MNNVVPVFISIDEENKIIYVEDYDFGLDTGAALNALEKYNEMEEKSKQLGFQIVNKSIEQTKGCK